MANIDDVCHELDTYSDKLSTQVRTLAVGLLAIAGGLIVSVLTESKGAPKIPLWLLNRLFLVGVLALMALALDLMQYSSLYLYMRSFQKSLEKKIEERTAHSANFDRLKVVQPYNESDFRFLAGRLCFGLKLGVLLIAVGWLVVDTYVLLRHSS